MENCCLRNQEGLGQVGYTKRGRKGRGGVKRNHVATQHLTGLMDSGLQIEIMMSERGTILSGPNFKNTD